MTKTSASLLALALSASPVLAEDSNNAKILRQLQFSPDGKYVLAQDDSVITVLTADPLSVRFRVQADKGVLGRFTPDSREIVFVRSMTQVDQDQIRLAHGTPRVERWRISNCTRVGSTTIPELTCGTAALAPDGRTLACDDLKGTLHVIDVASGEETRTKRKFAMPLATGGGYWIKEPHLWAADFEFSPDGRFLIALPDDDGAAVLLDESGRRVVKSRSEIKLLSRQAVQPSGAAIWEKLVLRTDSFAFVAPDQVAIVRVKWLSWKQGSKCSVDLVAFPSGDVVSTWKIPHCPGSLSFESGRAQRPFRRAADPNFLILDYEALIYSTGAAVLSLGSWSPPRLSLSYPKRQATIETCAVEAKTGRIIQSDSPVLDVFGNRYVNEVRPGEVGLWEIGKGLLASIVVSKK